MFHCTIQVQGGLEQDPQIFEGLHTFNNITFKHKFLAWVNRIEHHDFSFFHVHYKSTFNIELLAGVRLIVVAVPPMTPTSKRNHLQKATAICARLLGPVHHILCCPSALLGHPNIAQTVGVERTTLFHTLLAPEAGGDTFAWVVNVYGILGIHRM
jgi:hypothetical protein